MPDKISAAEGAIRRGAQTVADTKVDLDTRIKTVEGDMLAIGSGWQGPAAQAFQALMARWNAEARKVTSALDTFEENLLSAQRDYESTDQDQESTFNNLAARLG
ncbi:WXG100 family type VII secretion target [Actinomyces culturomici]|uniref:WXG100 family type VII secretion target n=1 Tax=Actinomyces culturomici TaxID=1926276 RepID=UPI001F2079D7|nr:WXG100 family type VII secretion target [Actinomyces culturomici]